MSQQRQWGRCMAEDCGSGGIQTRTVWCVHTEGWTTIHSNCRLADKPEAKRHCFKVCEWHQGLFDWEVSEWSACTLAPTHPNELRTRAPECVTAQHGIQKRTVRCMRQSNHSAMTERVCAFFSLRPAEEQACLIPCPLDCVVSDFSPWSSCSRTCGTGLQHRTRAVLAAPEYGGTGCPNLTETRTCHGPLLCPGSGGEYQHSLKVGRWSDCQLPHQKELWSGRTMLDFSSDSAKKNSAKHQGHYHKPNSWDIEIGYQTRQVHCTRSDGKSAMLSLCVQDNPAMTHQACVIPRDCATSDWSRWSSCSKTCRAADLSPGYRTRSRYLKQVPVGGGKECPNLEEKEACNIFGDSLPNCPTYVWKTTDWGDCQVAPLLSQQDQRHSNLSVLCGGGIQTRETYCVQVADGSSPQHTKDVSRPVNRRLCAGPFPSVVQHCSIPCPEECLLSQWSTWGPCLHDNCLDPQARKGFRQRRRHVIREPAVAPQGCPHLAEALQCENPVCFQWHVEPEEPCVPHEGACGPGILSQSARCVNTRASKRKYGRVLSQPQVCRGGSGSTDRFSLGGEDKSCHRNISRVHGTSIHSSGHVKTTRSSGDLSRSPDRMLPQKEYTSQYRLRALAVNHAWQARCGCMLEHAWPSSPHRVLSHWKGLAARFQLPA
ncbi:thrombospondin type-1 domain-containing protein 7B-like [Arapaima gigas]